MGQQK